MMLYSFSYLVFVPLVLVVVCLLKVSRQRQAVLLVASYVFYASVDVRFLALLVVSSVVNYAIGEFLRAKPTVRRLSCGVAFNVLLLVIFKYLPGWSSHASGAPADLFRQIAMPVGLSFWTFQALSYVFDIYREKELAPTLVEFCLYMAFWPTVLAGPVCRLPEMLPQLRISCSTWDDVSEGSRRIVLGLFLKMVMAHILAMGLQPGEGIDAGFDQIAHGWGGLDVWVLAVGYGFQLYFDFAGYSNVVIGTARLFGIRLRENFNDPYLSGTPSRFWTRWHMSLSFWIRDYVFLPLAAAYPARWWQFTALLLAMVIFGLWHGATVLFVLWGAYHGALLVGHRIWQQLQRRHAVNWDNAAARFTSWAVTFCLISLGWLFFRANSVAQMAAMFRALVAPASYMHLALRPNCYIITAAIIAGYFVIAGMRTLAARFQSVTLGRVWWLASPAVYALAMILILVWSKQKTEFVYLQF